LAVESKLSAKYWTSGSNAGLLSENNHGWCTTKNLIYNSTLWEPSQPDNPFTERCVVFVMTVNGAYNAYDVDCSLQLPFMCDVWTKYNAKLKYLKPISTSG